MAIRIGIAGYGNLGRGVELALQRCGDMVLSAVFTRRDPQSLSLLTQGARVLPLSQAQKEAGNIDVLLLCGGSATDLPQQGPELCKHFHTVDSFDTHARIPEYFAAMEKAASSSGHLSILSVGWDPGLFSLARAYAGAILPEGSSYTFWGKGVSQGHSDALRRIPGVQDAIQYTVPVPQAVEAARSGSRPTLTVRQKHTRECYVVAEPGVDEQALTRTIQQMPNYFSDYDTQVHFVSQQTLKAEHSAMPHGGFVIRSGETGTDGHRQVMELSLKLDSNPEFTASVLVAYARAAYRLAAQGETGARTVLDIPPALLSPLTPAQLRKELL